MSKQASIEIRNKRGDVVKTLDSMKDLVIYANSVDAVTIHAHCWTENGPALDVTFEDGTNCRLPFPCAREMVKYIDRTHWASEAHVIIHSRAADFAPGTMMPESVASLPFWAEAIGSVFSVVQQ